MLHDAQDGFSSLYSSPASGTYSAEITGRIQLKTA